MTRKHFQAIAAAVAEVKEQAEYEVEYRDGTAWAEGYAAAVDTLAKRLSYAVGQFNGQFDRERFLSACGVEPQS